MPYASYIRLYPGTAENADLMQPTEVIRLREKETKFSEMAMRARNIGIEQSLSGEETVV